MTKLAKAQEKIMNIKLSSTRLDLFPKLDKAQEKRFDKKFDNCLLVNKKQVVVDKESQHISWDELKQHLAKECGKSYSKGFSDAYSNLKNTGVIAQELSLQKKENRERLKELPTIGGNSAGTRDDEYILLDQAIKSIK